MPETYQPSLRAQILTRRTYNRVLDDKGTVFETWAQTVDRVIEHQRWLWKRQMRRALNKTQETELEELRGLLAHILVRGAVEPVPPNLPGFGHIPVEGVGRGGGG